MPVVSADAADTLTLVRELALLDEDGMRMLEQLLTYRLDDELIDALLHGKETLVATTLFRVCRSTHSPHMLGYILRFLADLAYTEPTLAMQFGRDELQPRFGDSPADVFLTFASAYRDDTGIASPAVYLAAVALRYGSAEAHAHELQRFFAFVREVLSPQLLQVAAVEFVVQACVQLARDKALRVHFFREGIVPLIPQLLTNTVSTDSASILQLIYETLLLTWLLSFEYDGIVQLVRAKMIPQLHRVLQRVQKEKCVRVALMALLNMTHAEQRYVQYMLNPTLQSNYVDKSIDVLNQLHQDEHAATLRKGPALVAEMVSVGMLKTLAQLCRRKFGDEDIAQLLQQLDEALQRSMEILTSFSEYRGEVLSGMLEWTPVHTSAKFWKENAMHFEDHNYEVLVALGQLILETRDETTLAVACHDLGEVVRYHPTGRNLLTLPTMAGVKERVLTLMSHSNQAIAKEALLCTQKIMVQRWEYIQQEQQQQQPYR